MSSIPGILERLMLTGRAKKVNKVHGLSASGVITCPKSRWIVITQIVWQPFWDIPVLDPSLDPLDYQLNLTSKTNSQNYVFRVNNYTSPVPSPVILDVYDIHESNVIITISKITNLGSASIEHVDFNTLAAQADNPEPPYGYGQSVAVMKGVQFPTNGAQVFPSGIDAAQGTTIADNGKRRTDYGNYVIAGAGNALNQPDATWKAPLIQFTCFEINSKDLGL